MSLMVFLSASVARAQYSSKSRSIGGVGSSGVTVGGSSPTSTFNSYSAGSSSYGNLYQAPQGGGALGSSIAQINRGSFSRSSANPAAAFSGGGSGGIIGSSTKNIASGALASPNLSDGSFTPARAGRAPVLAGAGAAPSSISDKSSSAMLSMDAQEMSSLVMSAEDSGLAYAAALGAEKTDASSDSAAKAIKTLAPKTGGSTQYRKLMREGEDAFRKEDYKKAVQAFSIAYELSSGSQESLLSLMHVHFATAHNGYNIPSHYLQRILKEVPELPLIPVHPRDFYGNAGTFVQDMIHLEDYVKEKPKDANAQFMLAYIQWRENKVPKATNALRHALEYSQTNEDMHDAIQTLWKCMVHSRAVSGKLQDIPLDSESKPPAPIDTMIQTDPLLLPK